MNIQELKHKLQEKKNRVGLLGSSFIITEYDKTDHNVAACISPETWDISISIKKGFEPVKDRRQKAYARRKKITNGLETLLESVFTHELTHWELPLDSGLGCPFDIYHHDRILEAVKQALPEDKKAFAGYVANAFEDTVINPRCKEFDGDFSGQVLFWDDEGLLCKEQGQKAYSPFYEAFVKLNMHLFGDNVDIALLKRHYANTKPIDKAVEKVIRDLRLPRDIVAEKTGTRPLFQRNQWPHMAVTFAKDLADLLETPPRERLSAFSTEDGSQSGNGIEQKMGSPEGKEAIAYGRYSSKERLSTNLTSYEQLDALYRRLARNIPVKVEAMTRSQSLGIAPLTFRPYDEERDDPFKVKTSKLILTDHGITFAYPREPLVVTAKSKIQRKSFPDFKMVILDNSGSMQHAPNCTGCSGNCAGSSAFIPWGDRSKYHFALLGFYGIEGFLQKQGIAQYIEHGLSLFSSSTRFKEGAYMQLDDVRKLALAPDWGSTHLDAKVLTGALKGRESFVLSLSDGEIENWNSEKRQFEALAKNNYYAHIQVGGETQFTKDLKSWSIPVLPVTSGEDISKLMVHVTQQTYRRFTQL